jgi:hypothetical protein
MNWNPIRSSAAVEFGSADRKPIATIVVALVLFVVTRGYILFLLEPLVTDVPNSYFEHAAYAADLHAVPYRDYSVEYPPLAWWLTYLPRLLDDRRINNPQDPAQVEPIRKTYHRTYRQLMFVCDLACFPLLLLIAWKRRRRLAGWTVLIYTISTACLSHLLYDRLDVALLLLLLLWAYCWLRSLDESGDTLAWTAAAYTMLGLSISFKLIPVVACPFLLLSELHVSQRMIRLATAMVCIGATLVLPFVIQYTISGPGVFAVFGHHAERGIQIESIYASAILVGSIFGYPISIGNTHGAFELFWSWSPEMKTLSTLLLLAFLGGMGLWALWQWSRYRRQDAYCTGCYVIAAVVILSNVFSPQYLIWAIPMMLLFALERLPRRPAAAWILFGLLMALILTTTWLFPYNYFRHAPTAAGSPLGLVPMGNEYSSPSAVACVVLALRNALYLGIIAWLGVLLVRRPADV